MRLVKLIEVTINDYLDLFWYVIFKKKDDVFRPVTQFNDIIPVL